MGAKDVLLNQSRNRHFFEEPIHPAEEGILVINILLELGGTLVSEA